MGWRCLVVAVLVGCYGPTVNPGGPCSEDGSCPTGLVCAGGRCLLGPDDPRGDAAHRDGARDPDAPFDAASDASTDGPAPATWGAPVALAATVNTAGNETDPSITNDRLTLYFVRTVAGDEEIFVATRASASAPFGAATAAAALNSTSAERSPEISANGQVITFTSNRGGNFDVYTSVLLGPTWSPPVVVSELSTAQVENDVAVSPDQLTALVSRGPTGARKQFLATRASVLATFGTPVELTDISVISDTAAPSLTNGAATIYFHAGGVRDLFVTQKAGASYPTPTPITELNTSSRDASPFVVQSNDYLVFERAGDLFEASR